MFSPFFRSTTPTDGPERGATQGQRPIRPVDQGRRRQGHVHHLGAKLVAPYVLLHEGPSDVSIHLRPDGSSPRTVSRRRTEACYSSSSRPFSIPLPHGGSTPPIHGTPALVPLATFGVHSHCHVHPSVPPCVGLTGVMYMCYHPHTLRA